MFLSCVAMSAQEPLHAADAVEAADTVEMSDEEIMKLLDEMVQYVRKAKNELEARG